MIFDQRIMSYKMESMKNETVVNTMTHGDEDVLDDWEEHELLDSFVEAPVAQDMVAAEGVSLPTAIAREAQSAPAVVVEARPVDGKKKIRPSKKQRQKRKLADLKKMEPNSVLVGDIVVQLSDPREDTHSILSGATTPRPQSPIAVVPVKLESANKEEPAQDTLPPRQPVVPSQKPSKKQCQACQRAGSDCAFCAQQKKMLAAGECKQREKIQKALPTCRYCKETGHIVATCPELKCTFCQQQGHRKNKCPCFQEAWDWVNWASDVRKGGGRLTKTQDARVRQYRQDLGLTSCRAT